MRIAWKFNKNGYVILSRLAHWPYATPWHKSCRSWWPLRLKLMLRPFMLTVHIGRDSNSVKTFVDIVQWMQEQEALRGDLMPFDGIMDLKTFNRSLTSQEVNDG